MKSKDFALGRQVSLYHFLLTCVYTITLVFMAGTPVIAQSSSRSIAISQVYGGGGNSGARLRNDFIELFNRGSTAVDVTGWSIQYAAATGTNWVTTPLSGTIEPGQYYLVQEFQGSGGSVELPVADASGGINLSAVSGKVALVSGTAPLTGDAPTGPNVLGFVGYGAADFSEGFPAPMLNNTTAAIRGDGGCTDSRNNSADFSAAAPAPRNSTTVRNRCVTGTLPLISSGGVTNATNFLPGSVAPGELVTIFGSNIGPSKLTTLELTEDHSHITNSLANTRALFDGVAAPLIYVSGTQVTAIVPFAADGETKTNLQIEYNGQMSNVVSLPVAAAEPGIFTRTQAGYGQAAVLNQDYSLNSPLNPAPTGSYISIYATGGGQTKPAAEDGRIAPGLASLVAPVTAQIGGKDAAVSYAGAAPGLVSGVVQINARVPADTVTTDSAPLVVRVGGVNSQPGATVAVRNANAALVCGSPCGTERWPVKTLTDADASKIDSSPKTSTVNSLLSLTAPTKLPEDQRVAPIELETFQVTARLVGFTMEDDMDFHVVIADPADLTHTMIVEIPSSVCANVCRSGHTPEFEAARAALTQRYGAPTSSFKQLPSDLVSVTGTGFFDFVHGQIGVAANGIELHPVLRIQFLE